MPTGVRGCALITLAFIIQGLDLQDRSAVFVGGPEGYFVPGIFKTESAQAGIPRKQIFGELASSRIEPLHTIGGNPCRTTPRLFSDAPYGAVQGFGATHSSNVFSEYRTSRFGFRGIHLTRDGLASPSGHGGVLN